MINQYEKRDTTVEVKSNISAQLVEPSMECRIAKADIPDFQIHYHHSVNEYKSYTCDSLVRTGQVDENDEDIYDVDEEISSLESMLTSTTCSDEESISYPSKYQNEQSERTTRSILRTSNSRTKRGNLRTSFSTLEIREYAITLGDNPGGHQGPPITIEWHHNQNRTMIVPIEDYEEKRLPRRCRSQLHVPDNVRMWMLLRGKTFSLSQVKKAAKKAQLVRSQRRRTAQYHTLSQFICNVTSFPMRLRRRNN